MNLQPPPLSSLTTPPHEPRAAVERLSAREAQILCLLAQGHSAPAVAEQLQLSRHTVNTHLRNSYSKLGVHNRLQAVARARCSGQID
jgi:DNA-binding CsgD family transcriptional regulator